MRSEIMTVSTELTEAEDLARRTLARERKARAAEQQESDRALAHLAAERFEFERLLRRIVPAMQRSRKLGKDARALELFARRWDQVLARLELEVQDPAGLPLSDVLAEIVEVESAVPDPALAEVLVRETLFPIVRFKQRVIGIGRVITSVPTPPPSDKIEEES